MCIDLGWGFLAGVAVTKNECDLYSHLFLDPVCTMSLKVRALAWCRRSRIGYHAIEMAYAEITTLLTLMGQHARCHSRSKKRREPSSPHSIKYR